MKPTKEGETLLDWICELISLCVFILKRFYFM